MHEPSPAALDPVDEERHATNLELFLDLVFVFSVTQITGLLAHDLTIAGAGRAALLALLVWWLWSQYTWAGAAVDLQERAATRLLVLATIPAALVMAIALPTAFGAGGRWFGVSYLVVQWLVLAMQGADAVKAPDTRRAFLAYASVASIAPALVLIGGFLDGDARPIAWAGGGLAYLVAALRGASGAWTLNPGHFAERHALFVIIALGEVLVAVGATATDLGLDGTTLLGVGVAVAGACVIWWTYFAFIPEVVEHVLLTAQGARRGVLARDLMTLGHYPIVAALIAYAVVAKHVKHPHDPLGVADRWLLASSVALLIGAYLHIQLRAVKRMAPERLAAIAVVAVACGVGGALPGAALLGGAAAVLGTAQAITWRRFRTGELAHIGRNR
ncbi:MAG: low temperature requirement protein A [Myxococcales bacterium]|nr:low temperature requirement protein A [Myxococcales bacterium]